MLRVSFTLLLFRSQCHSGSMQWLAERLEMPLWFQPKVGQFRLGNSVGGTPADAVETTALPKKSLLIGERLTAREGRGRIRPRLCRKNFNYQSKKGTLRLCFPLRRAAARRSRWRICAAK